MKHPRLAPVLLALSSRLPTLLLGLVFAGCRPNPSSPATEGTPPKTSEVTPIVSVSPLQPRTERLTANGDAPSIPAGSGKQPTPSELARRLTTEGDTEQRSRLIDELWEIGTPEAVEILRRQFFAEREADVKADIVAGLVDNQKPETREIRFGILAAALAPTQPSEVRLAGAALAGEFEDARAIALLQNLAQDQDEEVREVARAELDARREKERR